MASIVISLTTTSAANGATVTGYTIFRGTTSGGQSATPIATNVTLPYTDTTAADGVRYYYKAAGVNSVGIGAQSAEVSAIAAGSPTVTISAAQSKNEGNSGANVFTYTVTRSSSIGATSVPWSFTAGSTSADDFTGEAFPSGGFITLGDGVASGAFSVSVNGDTAVESNEAFTVLISTPAGYVAGASTSATGTILNDDVSAAPLKIALAGSSTPNTFRTDYTGTSNARVSSAVDGINYTVMTAGAFCMEAGNMLVNALNRDVKWVATGVGGTTVSQWMVTTDTNFVAWKNAVIAAGGVDLLFFQGGWNDAAAKSVTSRASHAANLRTLFANMRSAVGQPNLKIVIGLSQKGNPTNHDATGMAQLVLVRAAEQDVSTDANNCLGYSPMDLPTADGTHQTQPSHVISAGRLVPNFLAVLAGTAVYSGPIATSATAVDATHTDVTFSNPAGSDITPTTAITGTTMVLSDASVPTISAAVRQSANVMRLTHSALGGLAGTVSYLALGLPDIAGIVFDNGTPVRPSLPTRSPLPFSATTPPVDTTAPVETAPTDAANGSTGATLSVSTNEANGTLYWFVSTSGTAPSAANLKTGTGAAAFGNQAVTATGVQNITAAGLTASTPYYAYFLHRDAAGNDSTISAADGFTTGAAGAAKSAQIDPTWSTLPVPAGWNRWNAAAGNDTTSGILPADLTNVLTPAGVVTGWTAKVVAAPTMQAFSTPNGASTGANTGVFPDQVMQSTWYGSDITVRISGLDNAKQYTLKVRGSRAATRESFAVQVSGQTTQNMDPSNNTATALTFANVAPTTGYIEFTCHQTGAQPAFLDGFTILEQ